MSRDYWQQHRKLSALEFCASRRRNAEFLEAPDTALRRRIVPSASTELLISNLLHVIITQSRKQLYLAVGTVGIAVIMAILVVQKFTLLGEIRASVLEDFYVRDLAENSPDILKASITIDDAALNQAPKLKEIIEGAYAAKDNSAPVPRDYTSELSVFDYHSIRALTEKNLLAAERFSECDCVVAEYGGFYYHISISRR